MSSPIELVTFVTRAENRIAVLRALAEGPRNRQDLQDATGIPRATLARILADLRDRDLATRAGHEYAITGLGEVLIDGLEAVFESVAAMETLETVREWLAIDEYDVPIERLSDADVVVPAPNDPLAPVRRAEALLSEASRVRLLAYSMVPGCLAAVRGAVVDGRQTFEGVLTAGAVETMRGDPEMARHGRELLEDPNATAYVHPAETLPLVFVVDEAVFVAVIGDAGTIQGHIETTDAAVVAWANGTIDRFVAEADPMEPERLTH